MLTTLFASLLLFAVLVVANAAILLTIASLLRVPKPSFASSTLIAAVNPCAQILVLAGLYATYKQSAVLVGIVVVLGLIVALVMPAILIRRLFAAKWGKSFAVYFLWGIAGSLLNVAIALGVRAFVVETYQVPTSGMSPTIRGVHRLGTCPHCGGSLIVSTPLDQDGQPMTENKQGICAECWRFGDAPEVDSEIQFGDRIISNKWLQPKRWDIATYYSPVDPGVLYSQRIVGLPGESVLIKEGQLWLDGVAQSPPPGLEKLVYAGREEMEKQPGGGYGLEWGVEDKPCQLAADEYFMLGDNTLRSSDSRFFGPVKTGRVTGVVTMRYWPPGRVNSLRNSTESLP